MPSKISGNWIVFRYIYIFQELSCIYVLWCILFFTNHFSSKVPTHPQPWVQHAREKDIWNFAKVQSVHWCGKTAFIFFHSIFHNPNLFITYSIPFISLLCDSGSHSVIICISKWRAQQDTQLHSTNSIMSGGIFTNVELPESFQLLSMLIFCNYENTLNFLHIPHPQATTNNDCELR